ncbi:MAG: class I SAM-dependent methyltransferase [Planctomycetes bacterium]|nr:class I SAM-dependent methyltransferase [Planctomycetota bacterium]
MEVGAVRHADSRRDRRRRRKRFAQPGAARHHPRPVDALLDSARSALLRRRDLLARLHAEGTDCYRLLHGVAEGAPGVTVDRYGPLLLVQTFRAPLPGTAIDALGELVRATVAADLLVAHHHRGAVPEPGFAWHQPTDAALQEHVCTEAGMRFLVRARHRGQDPWLFLDLRAGRRVARELAPGRRVLNLFAYTCGVGVAAAVAGASRVLNVDFAASALEVGQRNAAANGIDPARCTTLLSDCIPILRQLAGQPVQRRGKHLPYVRIEPQPFDLVVLDPPRFAQGRFGTVDVVHDYASLWKPCLRTLADGGSVLATNHVPDVDEADWHRALRRAADKAGRPLRSLTAVAVDDDFPSFDGRPPLKVALATV